VGGWLVVGVAGILLWVTGIGILLLVIRHPSRLLSSVGMRLRVAGVAPAMANPTVHVARVGQPDLAAVDLRAGCHAQHVGGLVDGVELHEGEAAREAGGLVAHQADVLDLRVRGERRADLRAMI
jgi:hypothetical protein